MKNALKYMDIVEWTIEQVANGAFKPKAKFLSENELGLRFGFSRQTVRRALEALEQQGYITRIQGKGTFISYGNSRPFAKDGNASMTIGIISTYIDDYIFPRIIRGIEGVLSAKGYAVQLASTNNFVGVEARALLLMMERRVDGLIVVPTRSALPCVNLDLYNTIKQSGIPIVLINSSYPELSIPYVSLDDVKAGYIATQYLLSMGHTNIAGVFPHIKQQGHLRYLGYVKALAEQGIPFQDERVFWYSNDEFLQMMQEDLLWESLFSCSAALCFNDQMALKLIDFVRQKGLSVPEDFSVVGIDDSELAKISSLTSVVHPSEQLGDAAAKLLLSMINGYEGKSILFPPQLQIRGSVGQRDVKL